MFDDPSLRTVEGFLGIKTLALSGNVFHDDDDDDDDDDDHQHHDHPDHHDHQQYDIRPKGFLKFQTPKLPHQTNKQGRPRISTVTPSNRDPSVSALGDDPQRCSIRP